MIKELISISPYFCGMLSADLHMIRDSLRMGNTKQALERAEETIKLLDEKAREFYAAEQTKEST